MTKLRTAMFAVSAVAFATASAASAQQIKHAWWETKGVLGSTITLPGDITDIGTRLSPEIGAPSPGSPVFIGFEGSTQYDNALLARNFIPPDTIGAVGATQYVVTTNGSYSVYDKNTGVRQQIIQDNAFWAAAGQVGSNGDTRIMYNADANRFVMVAFGANTKDLQIAVSDTSDALGTWKSTKFEGYAGFGFGATADYPTLALDKNAVYIGTNNFAPLTSGGANQFRGTTLNVIPLNSLFSAGAPTTANMKQFVTPYDQATGTGADRGFAIQGVNSNSVGSTGKVMAASLFNYDSIRYNVNGLNANSALGGTESAVQFIGEAAFQTQGPARQPADIAANRRIIDSLDERISSSVYEVNGRIYMLHTVDSLLDGRDESVLRLVVLDSATNAIIDQKDIGTAGYDRYQGSIAVNQYGEVVIGYNRSGADPVTGKIGFYTQIFFTADNGTVYSNGEEYLLKESLTNDYHNGSLKGQAAAGRQRWGDYSQVSVDPTDPHKFYLIGEFAREYNTPEDGHPGGTGGSRWSTWVAGVNVAAVPEPATWAMMIAGFGMVGFAMRRSRKVNVSFA